jgi:hypothetical protein
MNSQRSINPSAPSVLFIGGHPRSGTTLLSRLLGEQSSVVSVGELIFIGDRGFHDNQLCSCGKPFHECEFWTEVVAQAAGPSPAKWFARFVRLKEEIARIRYVPALALSGNGRAGVPVPARSSEYIDMIGEVFNAIATVAGADIIVDSSKHPPYGFFLNKCKGFDLYPTHLVRDCRAVAFSQQRTRVRPEIHWTTEFMPQFSPSRTTFDWTLFNSLIQLLGKTTGRYRRIRYEDMTQDPEGTAQRLVSWIRADSRISPGRSAPCGNIKGHELSGNPMRFKREIKIVPDIEWLNSMAMRDKAVATVLGAPLLVGYGYKLISHPEPTGA